jgi:cytochrome P450
MFTDTNNMFAYFLSRSIFPLPDWTMCLFPGLMRELKLGLESTARMQELVHAIIAREVIRRQDSSSGKTSGNRSVVQILMDASDENRSRNKDDEALSEKEIVHNVLTFLLAGSETTGVAITWTLYFLTLSKNKHLVKAIRQECDALFRLSTHTGSKSPRPVDTEGFADRLSQAFVAAEMSLTRACLKESTRVMGPATFLMFDNITGSSVMLSDGTVVEPSDQVVCFVEGAHYNETVFKHAVEFDPYRWMDSSSGGMDAMEESFQAFGAGSRVCPGMNLALTEGSIAVATIVCNFDFQLTCLHEEVKRIMTFSAKAEKMPLKFSPRKI